MSTGDSNAPGAGGFPGMGFPGMPGMPGMPGGMNMEALQQFMQDPNIQRMTQAIAQDPVFMEMAKEMQEAMLNQNMGGLDINGGEGGAPAASTPPNTWRPCSA